ncbi:MAG: hypothetical protein HXY25_12315 [Alphaproteobacteria bacterium]|nr:hypothetical protein [Alphaproteobacteria bacterium]
MARGTMRRTADGQRTGTGGRARSGRRAAIGLAAALCLGTVDAGAPAAAQSLHVQRVDIIDPNGFEKPLVASTILVPMGWRSAGGVVWNPNTPCGGAGYNFDWQAGAPDGSSGVQILPMRQWMWDSAGYSAMSSCPSARIRRVADFLAALVQEIRPGARILDFRPRPDISKDYEQLNQTTPMPMGEIRSWVEAGEVLIAYGQNGVDMRESVSALVLFSLNRMQGMAGMPGMDFYSGVSFPAFASRAPNGQLDFRMTEMIRKSITPAPEWSARIAEHHRKIAGINAKGAQDRSRIIAQTGEDIRQMQAESWRRQQDSSDRIARETSEAIRGVETYADPNSATGTVELDNTYNQAWRLNDGTYVLTDDASFNPNATFGMDGTQLGVAQ